MRTRRRQRVDEDVLPFIFLSASSPEVSSEGPMLIHLINLDRSTDRLAEFMSVNDHLDDVCRVSAVDGSTLNLPALIQNGVIERGIAETYRRGGLGLVFSHISLWDKAIATREVVTVCEDDAIFNRYYVRCAESVIDAA